MYFCGGDAREGDTGRLRGPSLRREASCPVPPSRPRRAAEPEQAACPAEAPLPGPVQQPVAVGGKPGPRSLPAIEVGCRRGEKGSPATRRERLPEPPRQLLDRHLPSQAARGWRAGLRGRAGLRPRLRTGGAASGRGPLAVPSPPRATSSISFRGPGTTTHVLARPATALQAPVSGPQPPFPLSTFCPHRTSGT